jgi:guanine deaminase
MPVDYKVVYGSVLNPKSDKSCSYVKDGMLITAKDQYGAHKLTYCGRKSKKIVEGLSKNKTLEVLDYSGRIIMPSFFDMHFHWVQDDVRQMPKKSLLNWLSKYTWPAEAKFKDRSYSKKKAKQFFKKLAASGTLGGGVYSSIHGHALDYAMDEVVGDFVMGNVLMTMNSPRPLTQTKTQALKLVEKFTKKYGEEYALTPRFAPTTHPEVMKKAAKMAKKKGSFIQTHLSETLDEIDYVMEIYQDLEGMEKVKNYTDIYKECGLLGKKTIMGHGVYLSNEELKVLGKTKTAIAHCPTSNAPVKEKGLGSGLFDFRRAERHKVSWALASDIGGGPFLSMFDVMRSFVEQNKKKKVMGATYTKALFRSTLAGAQIMGIAKTNGNLEKGKYANFLVLKAHKGLSNCQNAEEVLSKLIKKYKTKRHLYDQLIERVYFEGDLVDTH